MSRMMPVDGQLVSFNSQFTVHITTGSVGAELMIAEVPFDQNVDQPFSLLQRIAANQDLDVTLNTPDPGHLYRLRLFSPNRNDNLIDELNIPRLDSNQRRNYLTMCSEGTPQLVIDGGGTYVSAVIGSGSAKSRALLAVSDGQVDWPDGEFPKIISPPEENKFFLSSASNSTDLIHDVSVGDGRSDGWPDSGRLGPGTSVVFVALVWDSDGGFDFTWTTSKGMPSQADGTWNPPEVVTTKKRDVTLVVDQLVCLDDSDELSDGEATFKITFSAPGFGLPATRSVTWKPMETGSTTLLGETFQAGGLVEGGPVGIEISGDEDDSGSFPEDANDIASAKGSLRFRRGPGTETFSDVLTLKSNEGGDGFRFLMHCSFDVSYS